MSHQRALRPTALPAPAAWDLLGDLRPSFRGAHGMVPVFAAVPLVPRASLHASLDELWGVNSDLCAYGGGAFFPGGFEGIAAQQRFGSGAAWAGRSPPGSPARGGAGVASVTSQRLFPGVRGLLVSGNARAGDDMAALAWQLGAGAAGPASRDDGGDGGFGFATAASPLAAMLTELDNKEREVVDRLSALLQADELLPPATKLATVAASRAQFAAVREKILGAASLQVGCASADAGGMHSALCAAGVTDDAEKDDDDDDEPRAGLAPAGAADSDQEGSADGGRRMRPQRKAAAANPPYNERVAAARAALEDEDDTPLGSAATKVLRDWLFDHFLHPYPSDVEKTALAKRTGLKRAQVANYFINARVRVWRPAIFSMCAEMEQGQTAAAAAPGSAARSA